MSLTSEFAPQFQFPQRLVHVSKEWEPGIAGCFRFSGAVAVFPFVGDAGVAEDEPDECGETSLCANIVRQDGDAALARLETDHGVGGLAVVAAFVAARALRAAEEDKTQAGV